MTELNTANKTAPALTTDIIAASRGGAGIALELISVINTLVATLAGSGALYNSLADAVADPALTNGKLFVLILVGEPAAIHRRDTSVATALQPKLTDIPNITLVNSLIAAQGKTLLYANVPVGGTAGAIEATGITELTPYKMIIIVPSATNVGATSIDFLGVDPAEQRLIKMPDGSNLPPGAMVAGKPTLISYNPLGFWDLINPAVSGDAGGEAAVAAADFVMVNVASQVNNALLLADPGNLPADLDNVVLAFVLDQNPVEGGWSLRVAGHPQLDEARQIRWPGGHVVNDQIDQTAAAAGQLIFVVYDTTAGFCRLYFPGRSAALAAGSASKQGFYDAQNARVAAQSAAQNAEVGAATSASLAALALRTSPDAYASDELTLDFANSYNNVHGERFLGIKAAPGLVYIRAGIKGEIDNGQFRHMEATNPAIIRGQGYWSRKAATNLFLNSAVGVTQNVAVTAVQHTLSFFGTGTVTLSGASSAGPLVGTGKRNRVKLSFVPAAGALTITITGNVEMVSIVIGDSEGPIIQTLGASVAVAADALSLSATLDDEPWFVFVVANMQQASVIARLMVFDDGTNPNRITFGRTAGNDLSVQVLLNNVAQTVTYPAVSAINGTGKIAVGLRRDAAGKFSAAYRYADGSIGIGVPGAAAAMLSGIRRLSVGHYSSGEQPQSPISLIRIIHGDLSNANIIAILGAL